MNSKNHIRKQMLALRRGLSADMVMAASESVALNVSQLLPPTLKAIQLYVPIRSKKELDTWPVIQMLRQHYPNAEIFVPDPHNPAISYKIDKSIAKQGAHFANKLHYLKPVANQQFDLILVPVVVFDSLCNRLGTGGGYYDKLLYSQPKALKIGLAYSFCHYDVLPVEPHDMRLNSIVTEKGVVVNNQQTME